jgi:hypothetical protein
MRPLALLLFLLAACARPPDLPPPGVALPPAPALVPLGPILAAADAADGPDAELVARAAALEARAAALRAAQ